MYSILQRSWGEENTQEIHDLRGLGFGGQVVHSNPSQDRFDGGATSRYLRIHASGPNDSCPLVATARVSKEIGTTSVGDSWCKRPVESPRGERTICLNRVVVFGENELRHSVRDPRWAKTSFAEVGLFGYSVAESLRWSRDHLFEYAVVQVYGDEGLHGFYRDRLGFQQCDQETLVSDDRHRQRPLEVMHLHLPSAADRIDDVLAKYKKQLANSGLSLSS